MTARQKVGLQSDREDMLAGRCVVRLIESVERRVMTKLIINVLFGPIRTFYLRNVCFVIY